MSAYRSPHIPYRDPFPPVMNPDLDRYYSLTGTKRDEFRKNEIEQLSQKIKSLTSGTFSDIRDHEITRLEPYYQAFARVFGIDLRSVAITRIQQMATTMLSSITLIQSMFDKDPTSTQQGLTFFDSRREAGGIGFNANSEVHIAGKTMVFSVVKRQFSDGEGMFEVDLPAYSLPREVFSLLNKWHKDAFGIKPFDQNPLLALASELISRRVHDWIHQAILYDTQAVTKAFQTWSDNSFFVKHLFDDPGMINYELLSNHLHFRVWQELFAQDPEAKVQVIHDLAEYYVLITDFCRWMKSEKVTSADEADATADFLAYIGTRGIFDIMRFDDPLLTKELGKDKYFQKVLKKLLPQKYIPYLQSIYDHDKNLPFRKGSDRTLSIQHILEEYLTGLREEAASTKNKSVLQALLIDKPRRGHVPLADEFSSLPKELQAQYSQIDITDIDPRVFRYLNQMFKRLQKNVGNNLVKILLKDIEVDISGYLYLKINRDEPDFSSASDVLQQKGALLVQIPYDDSTDHTLTVERTSNLLHSQTGAQAKTKAGDVILVNTQDETLANNLVKTSMKRKQIDIDLFLANLAREASKGIVDLYDCYPYDAEKALKVFSLKGSKDTDGKILIKPGYYKTPINTRRGFRVDGPISMDAPQGDRRRILFGAIVMNHVQTGGQVDVFPVHSRSFDLFYARSPRHTVHHLSMKKPLQNSWGKRKNDLFVQQVLQQLRAANDIMIYGYRGKPEKITFGEI